LNPVVFNYGIDLFDQVLSPRTILLTGGPTIDFTNGVFNYEYTVVGLDWLNLSRYSWSFWVWNGTIVSSTDNSVTVNWDELEETGQVCINYWVNCPGGQAYSKNYCLTVIIDEDML
jgi:hypothetical protein